MNIKECKCGKIISMNKINCMTCNVKVMVNDMPML